MKHKRQHGILVSIRICAILLFCCFCGTLSAQNLREINGTVTDTSGEPLIGVSVLVKENSNASITDINGKFYVNAAIGSTLQVSYVGYSTQDVKITSASPLHIVLKEDTKHLEEVVVVGYGTQKKVNLTGSVSSITAGELANKPGIIEAVQLKPWQVWLQGLVY